VHLRVDELSTFHIAWPMGPRVRGLPQLRCFLGAGRSAMPVDQVECTTKRAKTTYKLVLTPPECERACCFDFSFQHAAPSQAFQVLCTLELHTSIKREGSNTFYRAYCAVRACQLQRDACPCGTRAHVCCRCDNKHDCGRSALLKSTRRLHVHVKWNCLFVYTPATPHAARRVQAKRRIVPTVAPNNAPACLGRYKCVQLC
jgi:hypothetical protein